jgi:hypothetical protein
MNKFEHFSDSEGRIDSLASTLMKLQNIYEEEKARQSDSIPCDCKYFETIEIKARSFQFDELVEPMSVFLRDSKHINSQKQNFYAGKFKTSVSNRIYTKDLNQEKIIRRATSLRWFQLLSLKLYNKLNELLLIRDEGFSLVFIVLMLVGILIGILLGIVITRLLWDEILFGGFFGLYAGMFLTLGLIEYFGKLVNFKKIRIHIKKARQLKLPALRQTFLELQTLNLAPYVEFYCSSDWINITLWCRYTQEFEKLFK